MDEQAGTHRRRGDGSNLSLCSRGKWNKNHEGGIVPGRPPLRGNPRTGPSACGGGAVQLLPDRWPVHLQAPPPQRLQEVQAVWPHRPGEAHRVPDAAASLRPQGHRDHVRWGREVPAAPLPPRPREVPPGPP